MYRGIYSWQANYFPDEDSDTHKGGHRRGKWGRWGGKAWGPFTSTTKPSVKAFAECPHDKKKMQIAAALGID